MSYVSSNGLGPYAVSIQDSVSGVERQFPVDTSFEPYRREAFRHRTIPAQRQSIMMTNIVGEGTVNTEGLWRREQTEWTMGAGQAYLDRKQESQETRFLKSKGVDVFSYPLQASLLPDTYRIDTGTAPVKNLIARVGDYVVVVNGVLFSGFSVTYYNTSATSVGSTWSGGTTCTFDGTIYQTVSGTNNTAPSIIYSITSSGSYIYLATDTGIWFCNIGNSGGSWLTGASAFALFAANDFVSPYTGGYDMIRWANDQLIASRGNRLYAFQNRYATGSGSGAPFGAPPSTGNINATIGEIINGGSGSGLGYTTSAHNLSLGQTISISNSQSGCDITAMTSVSNGVVTVTVSGYSGLQVGEVVTVNLYYSSVGNMTSEVVTITNAGTLSGSSTIGITFNTKVFTTTSGFYGGNFLGQEGFGFNGTHYVNGLNYDPTYFSIALPSTATARTFGGNINNNYPADVLYTHPNPQWVWSDAIGGATQVYFAGYIKGTSGTPVSYGGCIYRSSMPGASVTSATGLGTTSSSSVVQPWILTSPIQALPMSPDEYPTCLFSYLNYIFIGTNRGIRMTQTLSQYDPTATMTGDLKSGPLIPNILQPVSLPVTSIIGDGRFIWFSWNNYDATSTGLGKLDLSNFIAGDPLAPSYASDLMITGQGTISSMVWDPYHNVPLVAVNGLGVFAPYASNAGGNMVVSKYVASGTITSGTFDYGIPDQKMPVYFDTNCVISSGSVSANIILDPGSPSTSTLATGSITTSGTSEVALANTKAEQFQVQVVLNSGTSNTVSPILHRWCLKAWPTVVQGTAISVVLQLFSVNVVSGMEIFTDPYDNFNWLEQLRQSQNLVTYTEGPLSATCIIEGMDWIPHKRRDNYENGFEGDCVLTLKTIGQYVYASPSTVLV